MNIRSTALGVFVAIAVLGFSAQAARQKARSAMDVKKGINFILENCAAEKVPVQIHTKAGVFDGVIQDIGRDALALLTEPRRFHKIMLYIPRTNVIAVGHAQNNEE